MGRAVPAQRAAAPAQARPSNRAVPARPIYFRAVPCLGRANFPVPRAGPLGPAQLAIFTYKCARERVLREVNSTPEHSVPR